MTNVIKKNIPNTVTCLNLFSGCIACVMAFEARYELALLFIILSSVFDFFDGMLARALNAHSIIGSGKHGIYRSLPAVRCILNLCILCFAAGKVQ